MGYMDASGVRARLVRNGDQVEVYINGGVNFENGSNPLLLWKRWYGSINVIVVKVPGRTVWKSLGRQGYAPAEFEIMSVVKDEGVNDRGELILYVRRYLDVPIRKADVDVDKLFGTDQTATV